MSRANRIRIDPQALLDGRRELLHHELALSSAPDSVRPAVEADRDLSATACARAACDLTTLVEALSRAGRERSPVQREWRAAVDEATVGAAPSPALLRAEVTDELR